MRARWTFPCVLLALLLPTATATTLGADVGAEHACLDAGPLADDPCLDARGDNEVCIRVGDPSKGDCPLADGVLCGAEDACVEAVPHPCLGAISCELRACQAFLAGGACAHTAADGTCFEEHSVVQGGTYSRGCASLDERRCAVAWREACVAFPQE